MNKYYIGVNYSASAEFAVLANSEQEALEIGRSLLTKVNGVDLAPYGMEVDVTSIKTFVEADKSEGENFDGVYPCVNE